MDDLQLIIYADGTSKHRSSAPRLPRHWIYDDGGVLVDKSGEIDFERWWRESFGPNTPWGGDDSPALVSAVESGAGAPAVLDRHGRRESVPRHKLAKGETLVEQDEPGTNMFLILDGMLDVEVDGEIVAEVGPGAIVGERASIEGGMRTSTLRAATDVRAVAIPASALDTGEIVPSRRRTGGDVVARVALVTGAGTGIGRAIAERLVADGLSLGFATHSRGDEERTVYEELATRGSALGGRRPRGSGRARAARREVGEHFGRLDVLVNNAGITVSKPALELTADDFDAIFAVDVRAAFLAAQAAARAMGERGGVIVNVTSVHEHVPRPGFALYAPAKAALGMLTRSWRSSWRRQSSASWPRRARSTSIETKPTPSGSGRRSRWSGPAARRKSSLVSWLVSDEAQYATGASFLLDGGMAQQVVES